MGKARPAAVKGHRKARLRRYLPIIKVILIASFVVYALYFLSQTQLFALKGIDVKGQRHLSAGEVSVESGLGMGMNIFRLNLGQARKRLLADPWIVAAGLRRQLPNRVEIDIQERQPDALLLVGHSWLVIDRSGFCIESATSLRLFSLPIITGLTPDTTDPGRQVSASPVLQAVLAAMDLSVEDFFSEVDVADPNNLLAYTREGTPVMLGDSHDLHAKLLTAQSLVANINDIGDVAYMDMRSAQAPAVKYKSGTK